MKQKIKNCLKIGILLFVIPFLLNNCERKENIELLNQEQVNNLNLKTVSYTEAKNFFKQKNKKVNKSFLSKKNKIEFTPDWSSLRHEDLYGIDNAQLTLVDVKVNRKGNYISKLFFINKNNKIESTVFTIHQKRLRKMEKS